MKSPQFIPVTLPLQPALIADPQAEKCYTGVLRENYPDSILEVSWSDQAQHAQLLPTGLSSMASRLVISETRLDGQEQVLMSRRQARGPLA